MQHGCTYYAFHHSLSFFSTQRWAVSFLEDGWPLDATDHHARFIVVMEGFGLFAWAFPLFIQIQSLGFFDVGSISIEHNLQFSNQLESFGIMFLCALG